MEDEYEDKIQAILEKHKFQIQRLKNDFQRRIESLEDKLKTER